jgi:pSer/pThr/pTyr-binding forkhead associated (FHA) protein/chromosome segregation ATPase
VARLQILTGKREGELLELEPGVHRIGTGRAEIQLKDKEIAYKHANVIVEPSSLALEDLGSGKGVFVNGARIADKSKASLKALDKILVGATELLVVQIDGQAAAVPDAGKTAPNMVVLFEEDEETGEVVEKAPAPPAPAKAAAAPPPAIQVARPAGGSVDTAKLEAELREMQARLARTDQENAALKKALDGLHEDDGSAGGYVPADLESDLEGRNVELQQQADRLQVELIELKQAAKDADEAHERERKRLEAETGVERKKRLAVEKEVARLLEAKEGSKTEDRNRADELKTYEEANSQLVVENDELKERVEALKYQIEQEAARRGELVRVRVRELAEENKRLEEDAAKLKALNQAFEEKIDELDERLEELEGENEQQGKLLDETRAELNKTKQERETMQKTLRQKAQRLEERVDELEAEKIRLKAQAEARGRANAMADGQVAPTNAAEELEMLRAKVARVESLLDDVEAVEGARNAEARVRELEAELAGMRSRVEGSSVPTDDLPAALAEARAKVEELEKKTRLDEKKIDRLERKNRELVRANIAAEMAQKRG